MNFISKKPTLSLIFIEIKIFPSIVHTENFQYLKKKEKNFNLKIKSFRSCNFPHDDFIKKKFLSREQNKKKKMDAEDDDEKNEELHFKNLQLNRC